MSLWTPPDDPLQTIPALPRSVMAFAALGAGMVLAREGPALPGALWFSLACAACAGAALMHGRTCKGLLIAGAVFFGAGVFATRIIEQRRDSLTAIIDGSGPESVVTVEGLALDDPHAPVPAGALAKFAQVQPRGLFTLDVSAVLTDEGWRPTTGSLRVGIPGTAWSAASGLSGFPVRAGERVRLTGLARPIEGPLNPGELDYRLYGAQEGLAGSLEVESTTLVQVLPEDPLLLPRLRAGFFAGREALRGRARAVLDPGPSADERARALLLSLFLGAQEPGDRDIRRSFTHVGLAHVLAISGFHLTVMAYVALFLVRLTGDRGMLEPAIVAALILLYLLVVPASAPVVRAGLLALALMGVEARGRRYEPMAVLGWVGGALILWRPLDLWGLGFQLSLGLTALLLWVGRYTHSRMFGPTIRGLVRRPRPLPVAGALSALDHLKAGLSSSLLCWATATPLIALRTGLVNPIAVVTSLVVLPPILALMGAGYTVLIAGIVAPGAGAMASAALASLASMNVALVEAMDALPGSGVRAPPLGALWGAAATATILLWFLKGHPRHAGAYVASALVAAWLVGDLWVRARREAGTVLRLDALAVGDGSCVLLRSAGEAVMWNCGSGRVGIGERTIPDAARALGVWRVPTVVISGADLAHFSGLLDVVEPLGVRRVVLLAPFVTEAESHPEGPGAFALGQLRRRGVEIVDGSDGSGLAFGRARLRVLTPPNDGSGTPGLVTVPGLDGVGAVVGAYTREAALALAPGTTNAAVELPARHGDGRTDHETGLRAAFISCTGARARELAASPEYGAGSLYLTGLDGAVAAAWDERGALIAGAFRRPGGPAR